MRVHYVLNHGGTPESKLADVEIHFDEGLLSGLKLVGCSVWRSRKGEDPTVLVPSRSYATAGGVRYYELLRPSEDGKSPEDGSAKTALRNFKMFVRDEYVKIAALPERKVKEAEKERAAERPGERGKGAPAR
jgi:hypothetical protein